MKQEIVLRRKWYNPLYFILDKIVNDPTVRTVLVYGGKSSAKTQTIGQLFVRDAVFEGASALSFRKESNRIDATLKRTFSKAVDTQYLNPLVRKMDREFRSESGGQIILQGLDNEEKAKGVEMFRYLLLDELNHFEPGEYEQFQMSMRGVPGIKIFATWNPVDERSWVKTDLVDLIAWTETDKYGKLPSERSFVKISEDGKTVLIRTVYTDNYWIVGSPCGTYGYRDDNLIHYYEHTLKRTNPQAYRVNVLGEWGKTVYGGEFLKQYRTEKHTGPYKYQPGKAVYLLFDENTVPYFPCAVYQVEEGKTDTLTQVHEFALKNPDNTTRAMGREITRWLLEMKHTEAVFIAGDSTSRKEDVKQEKGHDLFELMRLELAQFRPKVVVAKSNPSVLTSALFVNSVLEHETEDLVIRIAEHCNTAISDYENTKEDKNGKVDKRTVTDPRTKQQYQPFGHFTDLLRYAVCTIFPEKYRLFEKGTDRRPVIIGRNIPRESY